MEIKIIHSHSHSHKNMTEYATAIISGGPGHVSL